VFFSTCSTQLSPTIFRRAGQGGLFAQRFFQVGGNNLNLILLSVTRLKDKVGAVNVHCIDLFCFIYGIRKEGYKFFG
jgi:hypothetical protein